MQKKLLSSFFIIPKFFLRNTDSVSMVPPSFYQERIEHITPVVRQLSTLLAALIGGYLLFTSSIQGNFVSTIIAIGLDPLRAQLTAALVLTMGAALIGALLGRRKLGAILGAGMVFSFEYLLGFIQLERQPVYDPGGNLEPLNRFAFAHTLAVLGALALVGAFIGAAIGDALSSVMFDPPYRLFRALLHQRMGDKLPAETLQHHKLDPTLAIQLAQWLGAMSMIALLILASSADTLFLFSPDVGLRTNSLLSQDGTRSTLIQDSFASSALHGEKRPFQVYLPPSYNSPKGKLKRYPTLYLLHGSPGNDNDWVTAGKAPYSASTLIATGKIPELIMIFPDGNGRPGETSEWGNSSDKRQNIETYIATDMVNYVDHHYRTLANAAHRAIGGLSMGGFGAMNIAIHHPNMFGCVISLGGYYRAEGTIWGKNLDYIKANSPLETLAQTRKAWGLRIYIGAATHDQPYYDDTKEFASLLHRLNIPYAFDLQSGYHAWHIWEVQMYNALLWLQWK